MISFSCKNKEFVSNEYQVILDNSKSKNQELISFYFGVFDSKLEEFPKSYNRILLWKKKAEKIDSISKNIIEISQKSNNLENIITNHSQLFLETKKIILDSLKDPRYENTIKDLNFIYNIESQKLSKIIKSKKLNNAEKIVTALSILQDAQVKLIDYCTIFLPKRSCGWTKWSCIAGIDKGVVAKNQIITVTAGIGESSTRTSPEIYINDTYVKTEENEFAELLIKAPNKTGDYKVKIKFIESYPLGEIKTTTKYLDYKVVETINHK